MYYFGIIKKEYVVDSVTNAHYVVDRALWGKGYNTAVEAMQANEQFVANHLGNKFTVAFFEKDPHEQPA